MKRKLFAAVLGVLVTAGLQAAKIDSSWSIYIPEKFTPTEKKAADEIYNYVNKICKLKLEYTHKNAGAGKVITVKADPSMKIEEHRFEINGDRVLITGGSLQGIVFSAYAFIEEVLGCRFLSVNYTHIPKKDVIVLPEKFSYKMDPHFISRRICHGSFYDWGPNKTIFAKMRNNAFFIAPEYGWFMDFICGWQCHTFHRYTVDFPKDKPELFSMDKNGKRQYPQGSSGPGNLCFTNMLARELLFKKVVEFIEKDRVMRNREYPGMPYPDIIDISANDNGDRCYCPNCLALAKKYGDSYSDVVLEFTNDIARRLDKRYPGMRVQFFAYNFSQEPPKVVKAEKNLVVQLAILGYEFYRPGHFRRDIFHRLDHPNNRDALKAIEGWARSGAVIRIWDYWKLWYPEVQFPCTMVAALPYNIRVYAANNSRMLISENQPGSNYSSAPNFSELAYYLSSKLLLDPKQDEKAIIRDYMKHYYGAADKYMLEILDMISEGQEKEPGQLGWVGFNACYLTKDFLLKADKIFDEAEKAVADNPFYLLHIARERLSFDKTLLFLNRRLKLGIDEQKVLERLYRNEKNVMLPMNMAENHPALTKWLDDKYLAWMKGLPIPEQFAGKVVWDFPWYKIRNKSWTSRYVNDADAAAGKAMRFNGVFVIQKKLPAGYHSKEFTIGLHDIVADKDLLCKKIARKDIPADEKYHWYHLGRSKVKMLCNLYAHETRQMPLSIPEAMFDPKNPDKEYDIYVSVKLEGPSYVPGSKKEDAIYMDRVIFAE